MSLKEPCKQEINNRGGSCYASMEISKLHKFLCKDMVPHKIIFIDGDGHIESFELSHPKESYYHWEEEGE